LGISCVLAVFSDLIEEFTLIKKDIYSKKTHKPINKKKQKILRNIRSSVIADNCYAKSALAALLNSILKLFSRHWAV